MKLGDISGVLRGNSYPGRGILLGKTPDGKKAVMTYFIMGRSENSRNRIFMRTEDGIQTLPYDESKMTDPSLILYHPVRKAKGLTIITNGDQTDTIRDAIEDGHCYRHALNQRKFEPDGPHFTPRISGVVKPNGAYNLSILKSLEGDDSCCCRYFFEYDHPKAGTGHFISTYQGDGDPLVSYQGEPMLVSIPENDPMDWAKWIWDSLDPNNKVSLFVRFMDLESGEAKDVVINKLGGSDA